MRHEDGSVPSSDEVKKAQFQAQEQLSLIHIFFLSAAAGGRGRQGEPGAAILSLSLIHISCRRWKDDLDGEPLYASGAISEPGSVEKGTTRTDTMFLERQRGITIQAAVTSFQWHLSLIHI